MPASLVSPATADLVGAMALLGIGLVLLTHWWQGRGRPRRTDVRISDPWVANPSKLKDQVEDRDS